MTSAIAIVPVPDNDSVDIKEFGENKGKRQLGTQLRQQLRGDFPGWVVEVDAEHCVFDVK
jgi:hypothetical protein